MASKSSDQQNPQVSVVIPVFNEEASLTELSERINDALEDQFSFEMIFIDDGSADNSWSELQRLSNIYSNLKAIQFRRNYGKSTALQTGFNEAKGTYIATLDADLQDDPYEISAMIEMLREGYDLVSGWKKKRHDPLSKTIPSRFFNWVTARLAGIKLNDFNCGLKVYKKEVIDTIKLHSELHRFIPLLAKWEGYDKIGEKPVRHHARKHGDTKFGFSRYMHGFLDLITLLFVSSYHQRPMHFFGTLGFLLLVVGGVINLYLTIDKYFFGANLADRPLLLLGVMLMVLGAQIFSIGFLGELIFKQQNRRHPPNVKDKI